MMILPIVIGAGALLFAVTRKKDNSVQTVAPLDNNTGVVTPPVHVSESNSTASSTISAGGMAMRHEARNTLGVGNDTTARDTLMHSITAPSAPRVVTPIMGATASKLPNIGTTNNSAIKFLGR